MNERSASLKQHLSINANCTFAMFAIIYQNTLMEYRQASNQSFIHAYVELESI